MTQWLYIPSAQSSAVPSDLVLDDLSVFAEGVSKVCLGNVEGHIADEDLIGHARLLR